MNDNDSNKRPRDNKNFYSIQILGEVWKGVHVSDLLIWLKVLQSVDLLTFFPGHAYSSQWQTST